MSKQGKTHVKYINIRIISAAKIAHIRGGIVVLCRNWTAEGRWDGELPSSLVRKLRTNLALVVPNYIQHTNANTPKP
jgi:hypothetical protein